MARKKSTAVKRRSSGNRTADKLRSRLAASARKRAEEKKQRIADLSAVAGGAAMGAIDRWGPESLPFDIPGVPESGLYAAGAYVVGDHFMSGKGGQMVRGLGVGMMACAMRELVAGE